VIDQIAQPIQFRLIRESASRRDPVKRVQLRQRTAGNPDELNEFTAMLSRCAFSYVCGD